MALRGPDAEGVWIDDHVALGHRRLSIIDLEGGTQPMTAGVDGRPAAVITYSGEVYNFPELRSELASRGHRFRTRSDTEVVLRAYLEWGRGLAGRLNGMFAFAVWDVRRQELLLVRDRVVASLARLGRLASEHESLVMTGRSHNVAAQATTLGKRFATVADELVGALERLEDLVARYPLRGVKGPVGTAQDMLDLLDGDAAALATLEERVAAHLGFERVLTSVGQVYPRSLDFDVVAALVQVVSGPSNLATTIRLMAGLELVTEGFKEGQVGSSAMPHKMNTRSAERVNGLAVVLRGHLSMVSELAGDQWNEGDVSCSVVRRVALPDAFFATDGLFQTFLTVLDEFGAFPAVIQRELDRYLPFLATTKVLMAAVRNGVGREVAHEAIKQAAVGVALAMRQGRAENDVFERLAADERLGLDAAQLASLVADPITFTGAAVEQVQAVVRRIEQVTSRYPDAATYTPDAIL